MSTWRHRHSISVNIIRCHCTGNEIRIHSSTLVIRFGLCAFKCYLLRRTSRTKITPTKRTMTTPWMRCNVNTQHKDRKEREREGEKKLFKKNNNNSPDGVAAADCTTLIAFIFKKTTSSHISVCILGVNLLCDGIGWYAVLSFACLSRTAYTRK